MIHARGGRRAESRRFAEEVVERHLEEAPYEVAASVASATLLLARLQHEEGEVERPHALLERLVARYGQPGVPGAPLTVAAARRRTALIYGAIRRFDEAIEQVDRLTAELGDPVDDELRRLLVEMQLNKASWSGDMRSTEGSESVYREVLRRFGRDQDPEIVSFVRWARERLEMGTKPTGRRWLGRR